MSSRRHSSSLVRAIARASLTRRARPVKLGRIRRLVTIPISHFCEKARWALDRAGLDYREERHIQGVHQLAAKRAGGGVTTPVLVADEGVFPESEDILRYADRHLPPERRLFPEGDDDVVGLSRRLDAGLGPDGRRVMYAHMLAERRLMLDVNNQGVPAWEDRALRAAFPLVSGYVKRALGVTATTIADDEPRVWAAFDAVAERLADGRPHLCGERFTAADLTFAALAAPAICPPEYTVRLPRLEELPEGLADVIRRFRAHPAGAYALGLFRAERWTGGRP
jgi:glutathione S-transferase